MANEETNKSWRKSADRAIHERHQGDAGSGTVYALVALVLVQARAARELTKIRKLLEKATPNPGALATLGAVVSLVNKQGGATVDLGTFTPTADQDALIELHPADAAGNPLPIPQLSWKVEPPTIGELRFTDTGARLITATGDIKGVVTWGTLDGAFVDTATIQRGGVLPNPLATLGSTLTLVPKDPATAAARR